MQSADRWRHARRSSSAVLQQTKVAGSDEGRKAWALTNDLIKIESPAENDGASERPNKRAEPSISRLVADNDTEPSTGYSRD